MYDTNNTLINSGCPFKQHVHEILGSTFIAERCEDPHNHRFAAVSGEATPHKGSHVHQVALRTVKLTPQS